MSSSAPRRKMAPGSTTASPPAQSPFCYPEAQPSDSSTAPAVTNEQAVEARILQREAQAFERGRLAAEQQLRAASEAALARAREQISSSLAEFARERASYYRRIEAEVVRLALAIARKILHRETQLDPNALAGIARVTLEKLDAGTAIHLYVPPADVTEWRHYFAKQAEGSAMPDVHEDAGLPPGECRIETSLGATEVGIESQLKEIESGLLDLLAERPDAEPENPAQSEVPKTKP
jgi:flagellar assembly protein FliH